MGNDLLAQLSQLSHERESELNEFQQEIVTLQSNLSQFKVRKKLVANSGFAMTMLVLLIIKFCFYKIAKYHFNYTT